MGPEKYAVFDTSHTFWIFPTWLDYVIPFGLLDFAK